MNERLLTARDGCRKFGLSGQSDVADLAGGPNRSQIFGVFGRKRGSDVDRAKLTSIILTLSPKRSIRMHSDMKT